MTTTNGLNHRPRSESSSRETMHFGFWVEPEQFDGAIRTIEERSVKSIVSFGYMGSMSLPQMTLSGRRDGFEQGDPASGPESLGMSPVRPSHTNEGQISHEVQRGS